MEISTEKIFHIGEDRRRERVTKRGGVEQNIEMTVRGRNMVWCGVVCDMTRFRDGMESGRKSFPSCKERSILCRTGVRASSA